MPYHVNDFTVDTNSKTANFTIGNDAGEFLVASLKVESVTDSDTLEQVKKLAFEKLEQMFPEALAAGKHSVQA